MTEKPPFLRTAYNYDRDKASDETAIHCKDPSLTQQQFAEESDINFIAERYGLTGELPTVLNLPVYADFEGIFDFQSAQNSVIQANEQFMTLPAKLRARFDNNPQKLLTFLGDNENRAEAEFLGLVPKKEITNDPGRETRNEGLHQEKAAEAGPREAADKDKAASKAGSKANKAD